LKFEPLQDCHLWLANPKHTFMVIEGGGGMKLHKPHIKYAEIVPASQCFKEWMYFVNQMQFCYLQKAHSNK